VIIVAMRRSRELVVTAVAAAALIGGSAWVYADLESRVRGIILPDWGGAVMAVDRRPETIGPRWVCHSLANHWQINWYRDRRHLARCLAVPPSGHIEIVMGTQRDDAGREIVFQLEPAVEAILARSVPDWMEKLPIDETLSGVALRRWRGTRIDEGQVAGIPYDEPMFALVFLPETATSREIDHHLKSRAAGRETITFKPVRMDNRVVWSLIAPAGLHPPILTSLLATAGIDSSDIHWFRMTRPVYSP
jgi:hypothetical protein